jgi:hypothetical protein
MMTFIICRAQRGCNAWFWCKDQGRNDCYDIQSDTWVKCGHGSLTNAAPGCACAVLPAGATGANCKRQWCHLQFLFARYHGCKLLNLSALPVMPPDPAAMKHMHEASLFRSFAAGYLKSEPSRTNQQHHLSASNKGP